MKHYKQATVNGFASEERTTNLLVGTEAEPKHVDGLLMTEFTTGAQSDATIRIYRDTVKVAEVSIRHFLEEKGTPKRNWRPFLELDLDLPAGVVLEVGHLSGGTASNINYCAQYEIGRR